MKKCLGPEKMFRHRETMEYRVHESLIKPVVSWECWICDSTEPESLIKPVVYEESRTCNSEGPGLLIKPVVYAGFWIWKKHDARNPYKTCCLWRVSCTPGTENSVACFWLQPNPISVESGKVIWFEKVIWMENNIWMPKTPELFFIELGPIWMEK